MKLRCLEAFWILSTVRLSMRPWNPKLKLRKTHIDLKQGLLLENFTLGCSQNPKKEGPPKRTQAGGIPENSQSGPKALQPKFQKNDANILKMQSKPLGQRKEQWRKPFFVMETKNKKPFFGRQDRGWNQEKRKSFCAKKLGNPRESLQLRFKTGICFKLKQFGESKGELWYNCWNSKRDQTFASDNN